jgi:MFS family permease
MTVLFFASAVSYMLRVNMSVAAVQMSIDLGWTEAQRGLVLSSFFWGYTLGQIPFILLAEKFGGKLTIGIAVIIPSILTLFQPTASKRSLGYAILLRALTGFFQAATFPSCFYFFPRWIPISERITMVAFVMSGIYVVIKRMNIFVPSIMLIIRMQRYNISLTQGEMAGFGLSGGLVNSPQVFIGDLQVGNWESVFYVAALFGFCWFPAFYFYLFDSPDVHPRISPEEVAAIHRGDSDIFLSRLSCNKW